MKITTQTHTSRGCTYRIQYHIVWCVKYRRKVLLNAVEKYFKKVLYQIASESNIDIISLECMPDHVHILVECTPYHYIPEAIKSLKGKTARKLFVAHPEIKHKLWNGRLWNPSYFIATVSENTEEQIRRYIESQKLK